VTASSRYVLLGLAPARTEWFREVAQWANAGIVPVEFVKCLSAEEVRARLASGRPFSAALVDAGLAAVDRDFVDAVRAAGCAVLVVDDARRGRDWTELGAAATLPRPFDRKDLLDALAGYVSLITRADRSDDANEIAVEKGWRAPLVAVTGAGGTGASTVAIGLAQGLAADVRASGSVLLTDFCLDAEQAMLHDAGDVVPGIQELVEAFGSGRPTSEDIRAMTFEVPERRFRVLLGLRRPRAWSTIRPRAFDAALAGLRTAFRSVVADVDPDVEGEDDGGSIDVEERNVMARSTLGSADAVFVVGAAGMKGTHSLTRLIASLLAFGVSGRRIVAVVNRAPRAPRLRSEIGRTIDQLLPAWVAAGMPAPVYLPERHIDDALRDAVRFPDALVAPLVTALRSIADAAPERVSGPATPRLVTPGALGRWTPELEPR
jgi:MinD-like ATPase involved in chromosome partitioning or flagellar assembly